MRILVIRRDNIGDLVCTTPLFAALRARFPQAHIAALVNSYNAEVLDGNPNIDEVHSYTKLKHRLPGQSRIGIVLARLRMMARLRRQPFDYILLAKAGFDRQGLTLARQLRRRDIVGYQRSGAPVRAIAVPVAGEVDPRLHEVEVMQQLAAAVGVSGAPGPLKVYPDAARMKAWRERLPALAARTRPLWICAHVSAREASRQWPVHHWVDLIGRLADGGSGVLLCWSPGPAADPRHPGDDEKAAAILDGLRGRDGVLPAATAGLADLIAVLALCDTFIGADGGAMHLAVAVGLPVVALFENLEDKKLRWYPWRVPHELVAPQTRDIADISVAQVLAAWQRLAPNAPRSRPPSPQAAPP
jgi:heptosyltransferase-3